jgi:hypothetical protein
MSTAAAAAAASTARSSNRFSNDEHLQRLQLEEKKSKQIPRFNVSDVAALVGLHTFRSDLDLVELFDKYLYQDLDDLFERDCSVLDVQAMDFADAKELTITETIQKLPEQERLVVQELRTQAKRDPRVASSAAASTAVVQQIKAVVQNAVAKSAGAVTAAAASVLTMELAGEVRKRHGNAAEHVALDAYAEATGWPVLQRNDACYVWPVRVDEVVARLAGGADPPPEPFARANVRCVRFRGESRGRARTGGPVAVVDLTADDDGNDNDPAAATGAADGTGGGTAATAAEPDFYLIGKVDGTSNQLDTSADDARQWRQVRVLVEVKSRVHGLRADVPLHEQIQVLYVPAGALQSTGRQERCVAARSHLCCPVPPLLPPTSGADVHADAGMQPGRPRERAHDAARGRAGRGGAPQETPWRWR